MSGLFAQRSSDSATFLWIFKYLETIISILVDQLYL